MTLNANDNLKQEKILALRREACAFFGLTEPELLARVTHPHEAIQAEWDTKRAKTTEQFYQDSAATVWSWLQWAECEWVYGWPQAIAAMVRELGCESVLDYGCGVGEVGLYLTETCSDLESLWFADIWTSATRFLCERIKNRQEAGLIPTQTTGKVQPLDMLWESDQSFDAILCLEVIEHIPDAPDVLRKLLRRCRKGFCITGATGRPANDPDPLHVYKPSLLPVLDAEGWKLLSGGGMPWWFVRKEKRND